MPSQLERGTQRWAGGKKNSLRPQAISQVRVRLITQVQGCSAESIQERNLALGRWEERPQTRTYFLGAVVRLTI